MALRVISEVVPARTSLRQMLFFAIVSQANAMGRSITFSDVIELLKDGAGHKGDFRGLERSVAIFYEANRRNPDGLGWIRLEPDPDDLRKKYLRLSDEGTEVVGDMVEAMRVR